jgi:RNA polymerase sigma factor (TIGR02999 family)
MLGDPVTPTNLSETFYAEIRRIAGGYMYKERPGHTLQPSDLMNEALQRLLRDGVISQAPNRGYLFAAAAQAMRRVLVEHARAKAALVRGGEWQRVALDDVVDSMAAQHIDVLALHEALERLGELHPRQCQVIEMRFFGGFTYPEIAEQLGIAIATAEGDFRMARAFLRRQLNAGSLS